MRAFILLKDFNFFGKIIPKGTVYTMFPYDHDVYICNTPNGDICPHWNLTFMTVINNDEYFLEIPRQFLRFRDNTK
jgi:hypothetical protein